MNDKKEVAEKVKKLKQEIIDNRHSLDYGKIIYLLEMIEKMVEDLQVVEWTLVAIKEPPERQTVRVTYADRQGAVVFYKTALAYLSSGIWMRHPEPGELLSNDVIMEALDEEVIAWTDAKVEPMRSDYGYHMFTYDPKEVKE